MSPDALSWGRMGTRLLLIWFILDVHESLILVILQQ